MSKKKRKRSKTGSRANTPVISANEPGTSPGKDSSTQADPSVREESRPRGKSPVKGSIASSGAAARAKSSEKSGSKAGLIPQAVAFIFLVFWPCILHMDTCSTYISDQFWYTDTSTIADFFNHARSVSLIVISVCMVLLILNHIFVLKEAILDIKVLLPLFIYAFFVIISTIMSVSRDVSLHGMVEHYETVWVLLAYITLFCFFFTASGRHLPLQRAINFMLIGAGVQCAIGISQILGHDFWATGLGLHILQLGTGQYGTFNFVYTSGDNIQAYLSFYNPNYAAVYLIMIFPIALFSIRILDKIWQKSLCAILSICILICLLGTKSKSSMLIFAAMAFACGLLFLAGWKRKLIYTGAVFAILFLAVGGIYLTTGTNVVTKISDSLIVHRNFKFRELKLTENGIDIEFQKKNYHISLSDSPAYPLNITDDEGNPVDQCMTDKATYCPVEMNEKSYPSFTGYRDETGQHIIMYWKDMVWYFDKLNGEETFLYKNNCGKRTTINKAESLFTGYEKSVTARVYMWGRTIPLIKDYIFCGSGPDTFAFVFPQDDYLMRANTGQKLMNELILKPHNYYLQVAIQTGLLSLMALLFLFGRYIFKTLKAIKGKNLKDMNLAQAAVFLSVIGFLLMGITNDSVVSVSPIFWTILALGYRESGIAN